MSPGHFLPPCVEEILGFGEGGLPRCYSQRTTGSRAVIRDWAGVEARGLGIEGPAFFVGNLKVPQPGSWGPRNLAASAAGGWALWAPSLSSGLGEHSLPVLLGRSAFQRALRSAASGLARNAAEPALPGPVFLSRKEDLKGLKGVHLTPEPPD